METQERLTHWRESCAKATFACGLELRTAPKDSYWDASGSHMNAQEARVRVNCPICLAAIK